MSRAANRRPRSLAAGLRLRVAVTIVAVVVLVQATNLLVLVSGDLSTLEPTITGEGPDTGLDLPRAFFLGAVAGLLACVLAVQMLARSITRPLRELTRSALRLQRGQYRTPIRSSRRDELGALARTLDAMRRAIIKREGEVLQLAYNDTLTGLANRSRFQHRLQTLLGEAAVMGAPRAVLSMDLDRFKVVNDTLGHEVGDYVLQQVGERLRAVLNDEDVLARLGGDEFAILLHDGRRERAIAVAREVSGLLRQPFWYDGQSLDVGVSIGVARAPEHGTEALTLMRSAEQAMYASKRDHIMVVEYAPELDRQKSQLSLLSDLREAMEQGQLTLFFQPKVSVRSESVRSVEALMRWIHPERGLIPPDAFIPFAEQTGYIKELTLWAIEAGLKQCAEWRAEGLTLRVAVNVSTRDLLSDDLAARVGELLRVYRLPPRALCLEITESGFMSEPQRALAVLEELASLGVKLAIDDYGTGYSSLAYLMQLPVHELKVDRAFVRDIGKDPRLATIVRSTVDLGHNLGLSVVAEGVEDEDAWQCLCDYGCDVAQGHYFAPPMPANELTPWILARASQAGHTSPERSGTPRERPAQARADSERRAG
ncbi:MAG: EAL domain-containing protein [Pseudomonadota bacterium]